MGEEIVASYCLSNEQFPTKDQRKTALKKWGFTCTSQLLKSVFLQGPYLFTSQSSVWCVAYYSFVSGLLSDRKGVEKE